MVLPLLCAGDFFSLYHYWRKWDARNLKFLLPGAIAGIFVGVQFIERFSPRQLNIAIGAIAVMFVVFHILRQRIFAAEGAFAPNHAVGIPCGVVAGVTSSFAHGAGPVVGMFLVPQHLPKETFVATNVLIFFWINWVKVPFFVANGVITSGTLTKSLYLLPLVPVGVWLGVWLNRRFNETWFIRVVLVTLLLSGLQLVFNFRFWTNH